MPLTPADLEAYRRIAREEAVRAAREEAERRLMPVAERLKKHSTEMSAVRDDNRVIREEYGPAVLRQMHDTNHDQDQASAGQWRITESALIAIREEQQRSREEQSRQAAVQAEHTVILRSLPPLADSTEKAALVTQGTAKAAHLEATEAATQARNAGIDLKLVKQSTARATAWWRHPAVAVVIGAVISALLNHFDPPPPPPAPAPTQRIP